MRGFDISVATNLRLDFIKNINFFSFFGLLGGDIAHFFHDVESLLLSGNESFIGGGIVWAEIRWVVWNGREESGLS